VVVVVVVVVVGVTEQEITIRLILLLLLLPVTPLPSRSSSSSSSFLLIVIIIIVWQDMAMELKPPIRSGEIMMMEEEVVTSVVNMLIWAFSHIIMEIRGSLLYVVRSEELGGGMD